MFDVYVFQGQEYLFMDVLDIVEQGRQVYEMDICWQFFVLWYDGWFECVVMWVVILEQFYYFDFVWLGYWYWVVQFDVFFVGGIVVGLGGYVEQVGYGQYGGENQVMYCLFLGEVSVVFWLGLVWLV